MGYTTRAERVRRNAKINLNQISNSFANYLIQKRDIKLVAMNRLVQVKGLFLKRYTLLFTKERVYIWKMKSKFDPLRDFRDVVDLEISQLKVDEVRKATILERINEYSVGEYIFLTVTGRSNPIFKSTKFFFENSDAEQFSIWDKQGQEKFVRFLEE